EVILHYLRTEGCGESLEKVTPVTTPQTGLPPIPRAAPLRRWRAGCQPASSRPHAADGCPSLRSIAAGCLADAAREVAVGAAGAVKGGEDTPFSGLSGRRKATELPPRRKAAK